MSKSLVFFLAGALCAALLVVACSDDSPGDADAAACDCDPAEPPLAGRIIKVEDRRTHSTPGVFAGVVCPDGSTLLGGGCQHEGAGTLTLVSAGAREGGSEVFVCDWRQAGTEQVTVVAWATCLNPAP